MEYTFTTVDISSPIGGRQVPLTLVSIANNETLAGVFTAPEGYSARVTRAWRWGAGIVQPIFCAPETFTRSPTATFLGPQVTDMSSTDRVVVGADEGVGALYAWMQTPDELCTFFLVPGSSGTWATGVSDMGAGGALMVGFYWNDPAVERGLLRFHGFVRDAASVIRLDGLRPNDVMVPVAVNAHGQMVGYMFADIRPDNTYVYQAWMLRNGVLQLVDGPEGQDVFFAGLNTAGLAIGTYGSNEASGGHPFLYDGQGFQAFPAPTPTSTDLQPMAINEHGAVAGAYTEVIPPPPDDPERPALRLRHQFVATPVPSSLPVYRDRHQGWLRTARPPKTRTPIPQEEALGAGHERQFCPAIAQDATIVVSNGRIVLGRRRQR